MKIKCSHCEQTKDSSQFNHSRTSKTGFHQYCKECQRAYGRGEWKAEHKFKSNEERFWEKVNRKGNDDCWEWKSNDKSKWAYGRLFTETGETVRAHVFSYRLHYGDFPSELFVCHTCDNPRCVNPNHLFLGTSDDNVKDCIQKGRWKPPKGEQHGMSRFTKEQVEEIRNDYDTGQFSQSKLAEKFGTVQAQIWRIIHHKQWK